MISKKILVKVIASVALSVVTFFTSQQLLKFFKNKKKANVVVPKKPPGIELPIKKAIPPKPSAPTDEPVE